MQEYVKNRKKIKREISTMKKIEENSFKAQDMQGCVKNQKKKKNRKRNFNDERDRRKII